MRLAGTSSVIGTPATVEKRGLARTWFLVPAAAMVVMMALVLARGPHRPLAGEPQAVSAAFLENLDMLDDLDVLEAVSEEEL